MSYTDKFYITTTLPYANAIPHVGHAIEFFQADAYARYFRKKLGKENVFFNVGVDEHGLKVLTTANNNGMTPEKYLDGLVPKWLDFCNKFNISFDHFYRTSSTEHHAVARNIWKICKDKNDIYKKYYEGLYCVGCESFLRKKDLVNGKCPDHDKAPMSYAEENYFLKVSKYSQSIIDYIDRHPDFLKPESKKQELLNFLKEMGDISISRSRSSLPWGVEVPEDPDHTMYVWFDALTNYIGVLGFGEDKEKFESWWPGIQLCGPDNLRFQGAIWQGLLASIGVPFTKNLLVHGTILDSQGRKMSKSIGNVVSPLEQHHKFGADVCRFYMLGVLQTYEKCSYREEELKSAYNTFLANNYGNLLNRLLHLAIQNDIDILDTSKIQKDFKDKINKLKSKIEFEYENFELNKAVNGINDMVSFGNQYIHEKEPWKQDINQVEIILNNVSYLLIKASELYEPIIPSGAGKAIKAIYNKEAIILYPKI